MTKKKYAAIVLAAGKGARMDSTVPKQYLELEGKPILYYSLLAFENSMVDEIILVAGKEDIEYCQKEIVEKYGFAKVSKVTAGGKERYHSVFSGLQELKREACVPDYVMIHDGARPLVDEAIILRSAEAVEEFQACVAGMPVKDTIKILDEYLFAVETPKREYVWQMQTPQTFEFSLIYEAYETLIHRENAGEVFHVTDDAMVAELICQKKVKLVEGSYRNIKITTPEDLKLAEVLLHIS